MLPKKRKNVFDREAIIGKISLKSFTYQSKDDKKKISRLRRGLMQNDNLTKWLEDHKNYHEFFKTASKKEIDEFMDMVIDINEKYQTEISELRRYKKERDHRISVLKENKKKAVKGVIKKADDYAVKVYEPFIETKNTIIASSGKYNYYKHAQKLTEANVPPPRGEAGDKWFSTTVMSIEKRINRLFNNPKNP